MAIDRRQFLKLFVAALASSPPGFAAERRSCRLLSCRADTEGRYYFTVMSGEGASLQDLRLPARGHGVAVRPGTSQCVVLARRPGTFLWVVDADSGFVVHRAESPEDRHYYGHGTFDPTGRLLYVTENDFEAGQGVLGVYDAADGYRRLGELPSHGVGPHELKFLGDGRTLVVANGGIRTHPDLGRSKLNLADMTPNLAYIDADDGSLLGTYELPAVLSRLSIRHLDVTSDDRVCIAMQWEGPRDQHPPLVATHGGENQLQLLSASDNQQQAMRNYCGSVCCDASGEWLAASAPRGNLISFWSIADGRFLGTSKVVDGCGVAVGSANGGFWVTSGQGGIYVYRLSGESITAVKSSPTRGARWDNHLAILVPA